MSATTVVRSRSRVAPKARRKVKVSARTQNRVAAAVVQGTWVFGLVFFVTYFVASITGHIMGESQRATAKVFAPVLKVAREQDSALRTQSALDGSLQDVVVWAKSRGWTYTGIRQSKVGYVASR